MSDTAEQRHRRTQRRVVLALALVIFLLAIVFVPPFISVNRYKGRITRLVSASLGRPVRLSHVELRVLPTPGFVLTDLTVEEDPAYGREPVLHASTVTASIRLLSVWRGLEISRISVDDASFNLVRTPEGRWNVESLFRPVARPAGADGDGDSARRHIALPYLEATNSRINVKAGAEKLPYSLINTDLSFWQENPGEWRVRLRGQPARTDLTLDLADTGIVQLEASLQRAAELRRIPMHVDLEWREAQLGQLTRLLVGSDPGWRGDLTGELHLDGSLDAAQVKTQLRAVGVHRAEFAPAAAMDFDANCSFVYHYSARSVDAVACDSPVGDGRVRLTGGLATNSDHPHFSFELDRLPVAFALDALRTVRSGFGANLEARGTVSGKLNYAANPPAQPPVLKRARSRSGSRTGSRIGKANPPPRPLTGSFTVQGLELTGEGLGQPVRLTRVVLDPLASAPGQPQLEFQGLSATASIPAGAAAPLAVSARLGLTGYELSVHGQASITRMRDIGRLAGIGDRAALGALTGDAVTVDLSASGPWLPQEAVPSQADTASGSAAPNPDRIAGALSFRNAEWKAGFLANPVAISQATLHIEDGDLRWDPMAFSYGPVKATASLTVPTRCDGPQECRPEFHLQFGEVDARALEAAVLGAHESTTLLSELIARLSPSSTPAWPDIEGTASAESLILGPVVLSRPSATLHIAQSTAKIGSLDAGMLGGQFHGSGTVRAAGAGSNSGTNPAYSFEGQLKGVSPAALGQLLGQRWSGGEIEGSGKIELAGFTAKDLVSSAKGTLHFDWQKGSVALIRAGDVALASTDAPVPLSLGRFDRWTGDAKIAGGVIELGPNEVQRGARRTSVAASVSLSEPPVVTWAPAKPDQTARR
jgi:hypothetical protein